MLEVYPVERIFIYGLVDPGTDELRYIGKTNNLERRYKRHLQDARLFPEFRVQNWIISLAQRGLKPVMCVIEECENEAWIEAEKFYIAYFRSLGCRLTNHDEGGRGMTRAPLAYRERQSQRFKGRKHSPEHVAKVAAALKGRTIPSEARRNMSEAAKGKRLSEETKRKMSEVRRGRKYDRDRVERSAESRRKEYVVTSPAGREVIIRGLAKFCREHGLNSNNLCLVLNGKISHSQGWRVRYKDDPAPQPIELQRMPWVLIHPDGNWKLIENLTVFCQQQRIAKQLFYVMVEKQKPLPCGAIARRATWHDGKWSA